MQDVQSAMQRARSSFTSWSRTPVEQRSAALQVLADLRAAVHQLHKEADVHDRRQHLARLAVALLLDARQRKACDLAARVDGQPQGLQGARGLLAVDQSDRKRMQPMHPRTTALQQQPGALLAARHQRLAAAIQHEHGHFYEPLAVAPAGLTR
jgi:hypothetical protein